MYLHPSLLDFPSSGKSVISECINVDQQTLIQHDGFLVSHHFSCLFPPPYVLWKIAGMLVLADGSSDINILQKASVCAWR